MQITRQADYAVRAVLHLARMGNTERAATSTVAKEQNIPPSFLAKIVSQLSIAGLLHTSRGARGGVTLARIPGEGETHEAVRATYRVLDTLPDDERMAFSLRFISEMQLTEVAAACRVSLATVKRRLARAEKRFVEAAKDHPALRERLAHGGRWRDLSVT